MEWCAKHGGESTATAVACVLLGDMSDQEAAAELFDLLGDAGAVALYRLSLIPSISQE